MNKEEKEVLEKAARKLEGQKMDSMLMYNISSELPPEAETKEFFQEIESTFPQIVKINEEVNAMKYIETLGDFNAHIEKTNEIIKIMNDTLDKFAEGSYPEGIPRKIIDSYKAIFHYCIVMMNGCLEDLTLAKAKMKKTVLH